MRMTRLVAAIGIVSVVLAGGITAGLIFARDQGPPAVVPEIVVSVPDSAAMPGPGPAAALAPRLVAMPEPEPKAAPEPELVAMSEPEPKAAPEPELVATPEPEPKAAPEPELVAMPEPEPKANLETQMARPSEGDHSGLEGDSPGTVYTWQDGDRTLRVVLEPRQAVHETVADTTEDSEVEKGASDNVVRERSGPGRDGQPVFRSESGGELMTLPGGIILALDPEWDQHTVESFFSRNGIALDRTSELDFLPNGFFVETEPGFPSLELANTLADQDGVILSSPNWSREVELK